MEKLLELFDILKNEEVHIHIVTPNITHHCIISNFDYYTTNDYIVITAEDQESEMTRIYTKNITVRIKTEEFRITAQLTPGGGGVIQLEYEID